MLRRHVQARTRIYISKLRQFVYHNILHADDPPHRIALGLAIGVFVAMTPTIGIQMVIAVFLCWLLRANKLLGVAVVWLSNPATALPIFFMNYAVGNTILRREWVRQGYWKALRNPPPEWWNTIKFYWSEFLHIAAPLWLGSLLIGFLVGYITYYVVYFVVRAYRLKRWGQLVPPLGKTKSRDQPQLSVLSDADEDAA